MPIEIKGMQLRIRVKNPKLFSQFRTKDVGRSGRLQIILGYSKKTKWQTQAYRLNLHDYRYLKSIYKDIRKLKISASAKKQAIAKVKRWMMTY